MTSNNYPCVGKVVAETGLHIQNQPKSKRQGQATNHPMITTTEKEKKNHDFGCFLVYLLHDRPDHWPGHQPSFSKK